MRTSHVWTDNIIDKENNKQPVYCLTFNPDGSQLLVCCGSFVLVYNALNGDLMETLKSHKDSVYCVDYCYDGKSFASGGADKTVIVWSSSFEGLVKYTHAESIQCLSHNPTTGVILSCASSDFGLWAQDQKSVTKFKVQSRIVSCSWSSDGRLFALGHYGGFVSIRNRLADELVKIDRQDAPVWTLAWAPESDHLLIQDWNLTLTKYQADGKQIVKEKMLNSDPTSVDFFSNGDLFVTGSSDGKLHLWTQECIKIGVICDKSSWIWSCKMKPKQNLVAVGCNDGTVSIYQIIFSTVHGLYQDIYSYRENMTDVVINDLSKDCKYRIKCRDHVKKIAIFKDKLAVQLSDKIVFYEKDERSDDVQYVLKTKIMKRLDCNLLVITSESLILCLEKKLQLININGEIEREWHLDSLIRYIKIIGGPPRKEGVLVGLKSGQVFLLFINNPIPIQLVTHNTAIRCLDLSQSRTKLAVVDESGACVAYNLFDRSIIFQETGATSVAWNTVHDELICFSGNGVLNIKVGTLQSTSQKCPGFVVGFKGSKIFCLSTNTVVTIDVPHTSTMLSYLQQKDFERAYQISCLGVTNEDWYRLAHESLRNLNMSIARKAFIRVRDFRYLQLIDYLEKNQLQSNPDLCLAEICILEQNYDEAAELFKKCGKLQRAIDLYTDLNMWEAATKIAEDSKVTKMEVLKKKAQEQHNKRDLRAAAQTYIEVGDYYQASIIYGQNRWFLELLDLTRRLGRSEIKTLQKSIEYFKKSPETYDAAIEILVKLGNFKELIELYITAGRWEDAFRIADTNPEFREEIYLPYADWLAQNDRFSEAVENFKKAKRQDLAINVMVDMLENAITEFRFRDSSYYAFLISREYELSKNFNGSLKQTEDKDKVFFFMAELYYCYDFIYRYTVEPFIEASNETIFQISRYLLHVSLWEKPKKWFNEKYPSSLPPRMNISLILFALAKTSGALGAFRLERYAFDKLISSSLITNELREAVEYGYLKCRSNPFTDNEDLIPVCWACGSTNPLLDLPSSARIEAYLGGSVFRQQCVKCGSKFEPAFYSFENLPLIEFEVESKLEEKEITAVMRKQDNFLTESSEKLSEQTMNRLVVEYGENGLEEDYSKIKHVYGLEDLKAMTNVQTFMLKSNERKKTRYFRGAIEGTQISLCWNCEHFFHSEDYEYCVIARGGCPFCRVAPKEEL